MKLLSILVPGIRTHQWQRVLSSLEKSCTKHDYEVLFAGPFPPEGNLPENVKWIQYYDTIPVTMQKASLELQGDAVFHTTDDAVFEPESLDRALKLYEYAQNKKIVVNCRYKEGGNFSGFTLPTNFWTAGYHKDLQKPGIDPKWKISLQPLMSLEYFKELGGFDCRYEYSNHCHHDLMFRIQMDGGDIYPSPTEVANADHYPGKTMDHGPIHDAQTQDQLLFENVYRNGDYQVMIPYDNYKQYEGTWSRRFPKKYESYKEMMTDYNNSNKV